MQRELKRVLVVDDDKFVREAVSEVMSLLGFKVGRASNGREALALFSRHRYDLILTDFCMPGMNGFELASRIKSESPSTPVVLMTASRRERVETRIENTSVDHIVFKPFVLEEIADTVKSLTDDDVLVMQ